VISVNRFYGLALLLPILIPAVVIMGASLVGLPTFEPLGSAVMVLIASGYVGVLPYSLFALWAAWWIRGKNEAQIRRLAVRAPVLMLVVLIPVAFVMGASNGDTLYGGLFVLLFAVPSTLILGYAYVGLVFWLRRLARKRALISTLTAPAA
jgi:hypothetical protein